MAISKLLPTPTQVDWKGRGPNSKQTGIDQVIAHKPPYLRADSLASHSVQLDEDKERQMTVISGQKCLESLENFNQNGSSLKMLVASLLGTTAWYSNKCVLTWKAKVTKSNRLLFQLYPSMRHIEGIESGLLPTASTRDSKNHVTEITPRIERKMKQGWTIDMNDTVGIKTGLKLQPGMVEWMMGYPSGWTDVFPK